MLRLIPIQMKLTGENYTLHFLELSSIKKIILIYF